MYKEAGQKGNFRKMSVLPVWGLPGAIYSPGHENRGDGLSMAVGLNPPLIGLILTPLNRS